MKKFIQCQILWIFLFLWFCHGQDSHAVVFQLRNDSPYFVEVIWLDTSAEPVQQYPMFTIPVNETQYLDSYEGHQFLFQYAHVSDLTSSFHYTKLGDDEMLILHHHPETGLSFTQQEIIAQPTYRPVTRLPPMTLNERFQNYVIPETDTPLNVRNEASKILYVFSLHGQENKELMYLASISPLEEESFVGPEGDTYVITSSIQMTQSEFHYEHVKNLFEESLIITNTSNSTFEIEIESPFDEYLESISSVLKSCGYHEHKDIQVTPQMISCLSRGSFQEIDQLLTERLMMLGMRDTMAPILRNYTCADDTLQTSKPIAINNEVIHDGNYQVQTLFKMDEAQIFMVPNFLTSAECEQLVETSKPRLERAAVVGENGAAVFSESRRAQQAAYTMSGPEDPLWNLYARILNFTNSHTNYDLHLEGQEQFTVIQYNPTDEYLSHCDGDCDGSIHRSTARVATAVLYCKIPELGGATSFTKADVFVRPEPLAAAFFTYMGPDGRLDIGYTEHSGCPIRQGEKWIATAWMREGVSLDHPHSLYDPSGFRNGEITELDPRLVRQAEVHPDGF